MGAIDFGGRKGFRVERKLSSLNLHRFDSKDYSRTTNTRLHSFTFNLHYLISAFASKYRGVNFQ